MSDPEKLAFIAEFDPIGIPCGYGRPIAEGDLPLFIRNGP